MAVGLVRMAMGLVRMVAVRMVVEQRVEEQLSLPSERKTLDLPKTLTTCQCLHRFLTVLAKRFSCAHERSPVFTSASPKRLQKLAHKPARNSLLFACRSVSALVHTLTTTHLSSPNLC